MISAVVREVTAWNGLCPAYTYKSKSESLAFSAVCGEATLTGPDGKSSPLTLLHCLSTSLTFAYRRRGSAAPTGDRMRPWACVFWSWALLAAGCNQDSSLPTPDQAVAIVNDMSPHAIGEPCDFQHPCATGCCSHANGGVCLAGRDDHVCGRFGTVCSDCRKSFAPGGKCYSSDVSMGGTCGCTSYADCPVPETCVLLQSTEVGECNGDCGMGVIGPQTCAPGYCCGHSAGAGLLICHPGAMSDKGGDCRDCPMKPVPGSCPVGQCCNEIGLNCVDGVGDANGGC